MTKFISESVSVAMDMTYLCETSRVCIRACKHYFLNILF